MKGGKKVDPVEATISRGVSPLEELGDRVISRAETKPFSRL